MKAFYLLARLRFLEVMRTRLSFFLYFGMPVLLLGVLGLIFANGHPFETRSLVIIEENQESRATLKRKLEQFSGITITKQEKSLKNAARQKLQSRTISALIIVEKQDIQVWVGEKDEIFGRGILSVLGPSATLNLLSLSRWGYLHYLFPGLVMLTSLLSGLLGMGYSMVQYRESLFLKKLSTTPLSKISFIASQIVSRSLLVCLQSFLLLIAGWLLFELPMSLWVFIGFLHLNLFGLFVFMGLGFLLACFLKTEALFLDVVNLLTAPLVLFSEVFFSLDTLPKTIEILANILPTTQLLRLFRSVLLYQDFSLQTAFPEFLVLFCWLLISFVISLFAFRWTEFSS